MGDDIMFETLMEIMKPRINEIRKKERGEGSQGTVDILRGSKYKDNEIKPMIKKQYNLTEDEALGYLRGVECKIMCVNSPNYHNQSHQTNVLTEYNTTSTLVFYHL